MWQLLVGALALTGAMIWFLVVVRIGVSFFRRARVRRALEGPGLFPYMQLIRHRVKGFLIGVLPRRPAPEVVRAFQTCKLSDFTELRDILLEVERLPTVRRGLEALQISSLFEVPHRAVHRIPSPYTHKLQTPAYFLPGIPARTFYDPQEFEWAAPLQSAYPTIKRELLALLAQDGAGFKAYMTEVQQRITGWNTFNFFFYGRKFEENCARCPETTALLESLPRFERDHIMFSALNSHAHIPPHAGPMNGIIRAHLPLIVPEGCWIRVGEDQRTWEEGKLLVFDDSFQHEVWNHSSSVRIVLFLNFWHPAFSPEEIEVLTRFRHAYERSPLGRVHEDNQAAARAHDLQVEAAARAIKAGLTAPRPA